jgi:hypothetical protein
MFIVLLNTCPTEISEWDFNINIDSKESLKEDDEDRYTGKMSFTIQGWLFHNHRQCQGRPILDIGTTSIVTNELEKRMDGLINEAAPLTSFYGSNYKNPRQFATSHIRLLNTYTTVKIANKDYFFHIYEDTYNDFNLSSNKNYWLTFDGYNLSKAKVMFVPKSKHKLKLTKFEFNENSKVSPKLEESNPKPSIIEGLELEVTSQSDNILRVKLPNINYTGNFDIIVYDEIDYDTFYNANGFYLNVIN